MHHVRYPVRRATIMFSRNHSGMALSIQSTRHNQLPPSQIELLPLWEPQQNELSIKLMVADDIGIPPSCSVIEPVSCNVAADTTVVFTPSVFFCFAQIDFLNFRCPSISLWFKLEGDLQRVLLPDNTVPRGVSGIRGTGLFFACRARSRRTVLLPCEYT